MKAIDVLRTIDNLFLDCHYPLRHVVLRPDKDSNYTVGDLIKDTLREDAVLTRKSSGQERVGDIWTNEDESAEIEQQIIEDNSR